MNHPRHVAIRQSKQHVAVPPVYGHRSGVASNRAKYFWLCINNAHAYKKCYGLSRKRVVKIKSATSAYSATEGFYIPSALQ